MPTYNHQCKVCEHIQSEFYCLNDEPWIRCDKCRGVTQRLFPAPIGFVKTRTLGSLADKNRTGMSDDEAEYRIVSAETQKTEGGARLGPGMSRIKQVKSEKRKESFGDKHKTKTIKEIIKMDSKQTQRYIENG